ncbi:hypothetical protein ACFE04_028929 [Oxalis oulophora]
MEGINQIKTGKLLFFLSKNLSICDVKGEDQDCIGNSSISVAIHAGGLAFQFYSSGVFTGQCGPDLDQGVTVVGYGVADGGTKYGARKGILRCRGRSLWYTNTCFVPDCFVVFLLTRKWSSIFSPYLFFSHALYNNQYNEKSSTKEELFPVEAKKFHYDDDFKAKSVEDALDARVKFRYRAD